MRLLNLDFRTHNLIFHRLGDHRGTGYCVSGELEAKLRLRPGILRILGVSSVWDQDWGLPRVKCGTEGCNPTPLAAGGGIGYIVKRA